MPRDARTPTTDPDVTAADQAIEEQAGERPAERSERRTDQWGPPAQGDWFDLDDGSEADALEQSEPVGDAALPDLPAVSDHDGSEADILEQHLPVPLDEEGDERR